MKKTIMKKTIQKHINEIAEYYCDVHPKERAFNKITCTSFLDSKFYDEDGYFSLHLCDDCYEKFRNNIFKKYKINLRDIEEI